MLKAFLNAFRVPDLRNKILFTLFVIAIYRLGAHVPVPVVDIGILQSQAQQQGGLGVLGFLNLFSGGALTNFAVFALGIMPYITSSIIMQLLTVVIPKLQQFQEQGEAGVKKINQWTRYVTVVLALLQSTGIVFGFHSGTFGTPDLFPGTFTVPNVALVVLTLTAGTALVMWLGELITQRGVGNGMSILIFASVISTIPSQGATILRQGGTGLFVLILLVGMAIIVAVVFMDQGQRRIPIQYAKRVVGRKMTSGGSTYLPLKVNQAGVIPIIFASSVLLFPSFIASVWHAQWLQTVVGYLQDPASLAYMVVLALLIVFFAYFYTAIQFDPTRTADNIRKQGGFIPGIRPGPPTATYLNDILVRITLPGSLFLALIAIIPNIVFAYFYTAIQFDPTRTADNIRKQGGFIPGIRPGPPTATYLNDILVRITLPGSLFLALIAIIPNIVFAIYSFDPTNFPFGGTSILIAVGVALETMKQIESQLMMRHYEGFLK